MSSLLRICARGADCYLTAAAPHGLAAREAARRIYSEISGVLAAQGLEPVQEKIYGMAQERVAVLKARESAFRAQGLDASLPVTYMEGKPISGSGLAGVQIWAVRRGRRSQSAVATARHAWGQGRVWSAGQMRFIYLPAIAGIASDGTLPLDRTSQARNMFLNAQAALRQHGFEFSHVIRTWIYLRRILDWYKEFNRVRNAIYRRPDFLGRSFVNGAPASTGIEGFSDKGDCVMDVLAVQPADRRQVAVERICRSDCQGPASGYGSAFSRAVALRDGPRQIIYVSGTASIDAAGNSVAPGNPERQSRQTLRSVAALLESRRAGWKDVCTSVLFCKDRRSWEAFLNICRRMHLSDWPVIALLADVCRPELLVELEAVAAVRQSAGVHAGQLKKMEPQC